MRRFVGRKRPGISLVEVLVAMTILLLGIFSLVQIFPYGFTSIIYGRNVSMATALVKGQIEEARARVDTLPDGVIAINPLTQLAYPQLPKADELTEFQPNPGSPPDTRFSDVNKVRRVLGETTKIPAPSTNSPYMPAAANGERAPVSIYFLNFSPIYSAVRSSKSGLGGVYVYAGNELNRHVLNGPPDDQTLAELGVGSYGIDYGNAKLYFVPVSYERRFKMEYSFTLDTGGNTYVREQSQPDNCVMIAPNAREYDLRQAHNDQPPDCVFTPLPAAARLEQDERLFQAFRQLDPKEPFSNDDPYQFKVFNFVTGVIGFNPLAAIIRGGGESSKPIIAKLDYDVDDWHIIHEDRVVPTSPPYVVNLTLNGIAAIGEVDEYQEQYTGLMKGYADRPLAATETVGVDVLVMDLDTGYTMDSRTLQGPDQAIQAGNSDVIFNNGEIDYRNGSIRFEDPVAWKTPSDTAINGRIGGKRIRIYYRTRQNWAVQLTKAFANYVPTPDVNNLLYRQFAQGSQGYLFFPIQDHDNTVVVDYTWLHTVDGQQVMRTETGEYHQILDPEAVDSPQKLNGVNNPNWWIRVDAASRQGFVEGSIRILRVRGVSVRSRALWREGERWRKLDLESYVSPDRGA